MWRLCIYDNRFVMNKTNHKPMLRFLMVLTICSTIGLQAWLTLFNNFAADQVGLTGREVGVIQSVREIPRVSYLSCCFCNDDHQRASPLGAFRDTPWSRPWVYGDVPIICRADDYDPYHEFRVPLFRDDQPVVNASIL